MADIELVIKIPEEEYRWIIKSDETVFADVASKECMMHAIKNGTPLPRRYERKFEQIVIEYPPADLCTYPEYKGKPYFSIKYEENGEHFIGFGTYNLKMFSWYLREYFVMPTIIPADKEVD